MREAQANLSEFANNVITSHEPLHIVSKKTKGKTNDGVVLISMAEYSGLLETLYLSSIPGMLESIIEGDKEPLEICTALSKLEW